MGAFFTPLCKDERMSAKFPLPKAELEAKIAKGEIDTVVVAMTDMQGRLVGKRLDANFFLSDVLKHGTEGCNYLLAVDVDMNVVSRCNLA